MLSSGLCRSKSVRILFVPGKLVTRGIRVLVNRNPKENIVHLALLSLPSGGTP